MKEIHIKEEIIRYLDDENYNYAILIDGDWGSGKTYFINHGLKEEIEKHEGNGKKRAFKYISLYGCKSVEEIEEKVFWSIIDKKIYEMKERLSNNIPVPEIYGENKKKSEKTQSAVLATSKKIINTIIQKFDLSYKSFDYIVDFIALNRNIFVFDDLERSNCQLNDLLGYINGLVEHEGAKVILVVNEKEVGVSRNENKVFQYLIASQTDIKISKENPLDNMFRSVGNQKVEELTVEELERRRKSIFPDIKYDYEYKQIREKLIGITIFYEPDFSSIMHKLIDRCKASSELKQKLNGKVKFFIDKLDENRHYNLRTFQFFLSKIEFIFNEYKIIEDIYALYADKILDVLIENCFMLCVEFKGNVQEPEDELSKIIYRKRLVLHSVDSYIKASVFEREKFEKETRQYIIFELMDKLDDNDPYSLLYYHYYLKPQSWVEEKINQVLDRLDNGVYSTNLYGKILVQFKRLKDFGFDPGILQKAVDFMIANVKKKSNQPHISTEFMIEDAETIAECKMLINKINHSLSGAKDLTMQQTLEKVLENQEHWAEQMKFYINSEEYKNQDRTTFLNKIPASLWIEKLKGSEPDEINTFRECLKELYPDNVIWEHRKGDMPIIQEMIDEFQIYEEESDLIKKMQFKWLSNQLSRIYQLYLNI